jgi:hypothetical protein
MPTPSRNVALAKIHIDQGSDELLYGELEFNERQVSKRRRRTLCTIS